MNLFHSMLEYNVYLRTNSSYSKVMMNINSSYKLIYYIIKKRNDILEINVPKSKLHSIYDLPSLIYKYNLRKYKNSYHLEISCEHKDLIWCKYGKLHRDNDSKGNKRFSIISHDRRDDLTPRYHKYGERIWIKFDEYFKCFDSIPKYNKYLKLSI